jgi:methylthioribulose-1-phosphate dehydratase
VGAVSRRLHVTNGLERVEIGTLQPGSSRTADNCGQCSSSERHEETTWSESRHEPGIVQSQEDHVSSDLRDELAAIGRRFDARGWVLGTSGNFSAVAELNPLRLAITRSGASKGSLTTEDILEVDETLATRDADAHRPSAEAKLHVELVRLRAARAVLHTHSVWSTLLSDQHAAANGIAISGYEMLKGLEGVKTHQHREWIPILANDQDMDRLAVEMRRVLQEHPACHAFLLHRHGLYTWGQTLAEAVRHVEILEFLLEVVGRTGGGSHGDHQDPG